MNYYKQFAEMLGLELEQEFLLTDVDGNTKGELIYKFTEDGLLFKSPSLVKWSKSSSGTILRLLNGDVKAVSKPWKPKKGDEYWICSSIRGFVSSAIFADDDIDLCRWKVGNCFKTSEEAKSKGKEIMEQLKKEYEEAGKLKSIMNV